MAHAAHDAGADLPLQPEAIATWLDTMVTEDASLVALPPNALAPLHVVLRSSHVQNAMQPGPGAPPGPVSS